MQAHDATYMRRYRAQCERVAGVLPKNRGARSRKTPNAFIERASESRPPGAGGGARAFAESEWHTGIGSWCALCSRGIPASSVR